jgi:hypothetical protein
MPNLSPPPGGSPPGAGGPGLPPGPGGPGPLGRTPPPTPPLNLGGASPPPPGLGGPPMGGAPPSMPPPPMGMGPPVGGGQDSSPRAWHIGGMVRSLIAALIPPEPVGAGQDVGVGAAVPQRVPILRGWDFPERHPHVPRRRRRGVRSSGGDLRDPYGAPTHAGRSREPGNDRAPPWLEQRRNGQWPCGGDRHRP